MAETEQVPSTRTWDGAASPGAAAYVQRFEAAWNASRKSSRPDPRAFLPESASERPAVLLAILRSEIGLRWEKGERRTCEYYRDSYPELAPDALVALVYEEFCLREESGDAPVPAEYEERFPELTARLRRVFDIHDLVGSGGSAAFRATATPEVPFPEAGQTTAGFYLREELGRGSFARVFLAEERQLADRPVALKVSRSGTREPQTLARLQHTHIVPVYSSRVDPASGLHLLCMPYFGRVTLEQLLAEPAVKTARTGADVLAALDRLEPSAGSDAPAGRSVFARLPYARALAWWGARMAEALAHAHDRGVLHRDIKPSNVLVTADGLPMLLDFNLARDPWSDQLGPSMGGTLAYMPPEHLEALAEGHDRSVDHRADIYALGVLLFEALTGQRPFANPTGASSIAEALRRAADARRRRSPVIRPTHPEVPAAMEAVVLKCIAVAPTQRYPDAAALAADLQAVADDRPLVHAREPFASRAVRWSRRRRWPIALAALIGVAWLILAHSLLRARQDQRRVAATLSRGVDEGRRLASAGEYSRAIDKFDHVIELAMDIPDYQLQPPILMPLHAAQAGKTDARLRGATLEQAEALNELLARLRVRGLESLDGDRVRVLGEITVALAPFENIDPKLLLSLAFATRERLRRDVESLLFLRAILIGGADAAGKRSALGLCDLMEPKAVDAMPWNALRTWLVGGSSGVEQPVPGDERSIQACLMLGMLAEAQNRLEPALGWYKRAARLDGEVSGLLYVLARLSDATGRRDEAIGYYKKALEKSAGPRSLTANP
jgi:tetratricopeptide (TPR) repeat protein